LENGGSVTIEGMSREHKRLWKLMRKISSRISKAISASRDEGSWTAVAIDLLDEATLNREKEDLFEVMDMYMPPASPVLLSHIFPMFNFCLDPLFDVDLFKFVCPY
jgi:hypothetical protein